MSSSSDSEADKKSSRIYRSDAARPAKFGAIKVVSGDNAGMVLGNKDVSVKGIAQSADSVNFYQVTSHKEVDKFEDVQREIARISLQIDPQSRADLVAAVSAFDLAISFDSIDEKQVHFLLGTIGDISPQGLKLLVEWMTCQSDIPDLVQQLARSLLESVQRSAK